MDKKIRIDSIDEVNPFLDRLEKDDHVILCPVFVSKDKRTFYFAVESDRQLAAYQYLLQEAWRRKIHVFIEFKDEKILAWGKEYIFLSAADAQKVIQNPARLQEKEWARFPIHLSEKKEIKPGNPESIITTINFKNEAEHAKIVKELLDKIAERTEGGISPTVNPGIHLIFDSFPDKKAAQGFASMIQERYERVTTVHETKEDAYNYLLSRFDVFPFGLFPPVVIVERDPQWYEKEQEMEKEREMRELVHEFDGNFAGT